LTVHGQELPNTQNTNNCALTPGIPHRARRGAFKTQAFSATAGFTIDKSIPGEKTLRKRLKMMDNRLDV